MWSSRTALGLAVLALVGCDRRADTLLPENKSTAPSVVEAGELRVLTADEYQEYLSASDRLAWCEQTDDNGARNCLYAQVGPPEIGKKGGATYTFKGTGGSVCLVVDPETVFWNQARAATNPDERFVYADYQADDGDIDMFAGLTSYYTGSPGVELGDFTGYYTDSLGRQIEIEYGECTQNSTVSDITNAHAGRATPEYCTIDTELREGVEFTVMLETFSVPLNDGTLSFGAMAVEGTCRRLNGTGIDECTIKGESLDPENGEVLSCSEALETAYCMTADDTETDTERAWLDQGYSMLTAFCCANPGVCGDDVDDTMCLNFPEDQFCSEMPSLCCQ